jgi:hypothetical protein
MKMQKNCAHTFVTDIKTSAQVDKFAYTAMSGTVNASSSNCQSEKKREGERRKGGDGQDYIPTLYSLIQYLASLHHSFST